MSNTNDAGPQPTGASPPPGPCGNASLYMMLQKLNETEAKFAILRQSLDDLEAEHREIRQHCEDAIRVSAAADKGRMNKEKHRDERDKGERNGDVVMHDLHPQDHDHERMEGLPGPSSDPGVQTKEVRERESEEEGDVRHPKRLKHEKTDRLSMKDASTSPAEEGDSLSLMPQVTPRQPHLPDTTSGTPQRQRPQPPTHSFFRSVDVDLPSYPPELKIEGPDWFVLFNPSPKVNRVLNVNMVHTLQHESIVTCVRFSRDGKWLATGCKGTAQIYNANTGVKFCVLEHQVHKAGDMYVRSVDFSPDGKYLATGAEDKQIKIWNVAEKRIHDTFNGHQQGVYSLAFSPDGRFIVSVSGDSTVRIWDIHDGTSKVLINDDHYWSDCQREIVDVSISPDGRYMAIGSVDLVVSIWEMRTGVLAHKLRGHKDSVYSVAFTPDGKGLVSGSLDKTLKYWDVSSLGVGSGDGLAGTQRQGKTSTSSIPSSTALSPCIMNITGHHDYVLSVAVSHDGAWVISGSKDRSVQFWDARTGVLQCRLLGHKNSVLSVDFSPAGNFFATGSGDWVTRIWSY